MGVGLAPLLAPSLMADTHSAANDEPVAACLVNDGVIANSLTARMRRSSNTRDDFEADDAAAEDADADEELDGARCAMGGLFAGINGAPAITAIGSAAGAPAGFIVHVAAAFDADGAGAGVEAHSAAASRSSSKNSAQLMSRYTRTASASRDRVLSRGNGASSSRSPPPPLQLASLAGFNVLLLAQSPLHAPTPSSLSESLSPLLAVGRQEGAGHRPRFSRLSHAAGADQPAEGAQWRRASTFAPCADRPPPTRRRSTAWTSSSTWTPPR